MAQPTSENKSGNGGPPAACPPIEDVLREIDEELAAFEAKKLPDVKAEFTTYVGQKKTAVDDYKQKYPELRDKWCAQQQLIERLYSALKCAFPGQDWKKLVADCVCSQRAEEARLAEQLRKRKKCCRGVRERARDEQAERVAAAKARLETLMGLAAAVDAQLTTNAALIDTIRGLLGSPTQATTLFLFFFKLLPAHIALRPDDISDECKSFGSEYTPEKLCEGVKCKDPPADDSPCVEKQPDPPPTPGPTRRPVPAILPKNSLGGEIDCAAQDYRQANTDSAAADAAYKKAPDDVASLAKQLDDFRAALDDKITQCLAASKPEDKCCTTPTPCPPGSTPAQTN